MLLTKKTTMQVAIRIFVQKKDIESANAVLLAMKADKVTPDAAVYTMLVDCAGKSGVFNVTCLLQPSSIADFLSIALLSHSLFLRRPLRLGWTTWRRCAPLACISTPFCIPL